MKIKNIKINSYGTLKQKEINLKNNINIIYGENESGKSTLLNYIKNMFYGISKNKNGKEISDYEKYTPWVGEEFSGRLGYELDDNRYFEIYRDFHKKNPKVFDQNLEDISNGFKIDKKDGNLFFQEQTGVDEQTYISTILSTQQEVILDKSSQNILVQKIANLGGTGDDKVSFQKAIEKLNKRQLEEVGTNRTQDRPLNIVQSRMKMLEVDLKDSNVDPQAKENLQEEKEELEEKLENEKIKNNAIRELTMLTKKQEIAIEKNNLKEKLIHEKNQKLEKLIQEKNNFLNQKLEIEKLNFNNPEKNKKIKRNYFIFMIIFILFIFISILNYYFLKNSVINYIIFSLIPMELILWIIYFLKNKKRIHKIENKKMEEMKKNEKIQEQIMLLDNQINLIKNELEKQQEEMMREEQKIKLEIKTEKEKIKKQYSANFLNEIFLLEDKNNIEQEMQKSNEKILEYQIQLNKMQYRETMLLEKIEKNISLTEEYQVLKEQLEMLEQKNKCFQITKQLLENAYDKMKNNVTPKFTQNLSGIIQKISNGKYKKVSIHEEKGLIVELENGEYVSANLLSAGTIDQLYLSLRLSMMDEITKEKMPIILDETFAYFDDERLKNILLFLQEQSKDHQIILFTCAKREKQILDKLKIDYEWITI